MHSCSSRVLQASQSSPSRVGAGDWPAERGLPELDVDVGPDQDRRTASLTCLDSFILRILRQLVCACALPSSTAPLRLGEALACRQTSRRSSSTNRQRVSRSGEWTAQARGRCRSAVAADLRLPRGTRALDCRWPCSGLPLRGQTSTPPRVRAPRRSGLASPERRVTIDAVGTLCSLAGLPRAHGTAVGGDQHRCWPDTPLANRGCSCTAKGVEVWEGRQTDMWTGDVVKRVRQGGGVPDVWSLDCITNRAAAAAALCRPSMHVLGAWCGRTSPAEADPTRRTERGTHTSRGSQSSALDFRVVGIQGMELRGAEGGDEIMNDGGK